MLTLSMVLLSFNGKVKEIPGLLMIIAMILDTVILCKVFGG